ncbi:MAG: Replication factor C small subunit, partial [Candidatus Nanoarchaeia archaeon]
QACAAISPVINLKVASEIISFAEPKEIREAILEALNGNFIKAKKLLFDTIVAHGLSGLDAIRQIQKEIQNLEINEKLKAQLIKICGEVEFRLVEGANEFIQLAALLAEFALVSETEQ